MNMQCGSCWFCSFDPRRRNGSEGGCLIKNIDMPSSGESQCQCHLSVCAACMHGSSLSMWPGYSSSSNARIASHAATVAPRRNLCDAQPRMDIRYGSFINSACLHEPLPLEVNCQRHEGPRVVMCVASGLRRWLPVLVDQILHFILMLILFLLHVNYDVHSFDY